MDSPEPRDPQRPALVLVTGLARPGDFFLGERVEGRDRELYGKLVSTTDGTHLLVRPFSTILDLERSGGELAVHRIVDPGVEAEARRLLSGSATHVAEADAPLLHEWLGLAPGADEPRATVLGFSLDAGDSVGERLASFRRTSRAFRDLLLTSPHLRSERELDRVLELDADLTLELGKVVHRLSRRFAELVRDVPELGATIEADPGARDVSPGHAQTVGWDALWNQLQVTLGRARSQGRMGLLEGLNALVREGLATLHGVLSDHASALDTLVAEGLAEYGLEGAWELVPAPPAPERGSGLPVFPRLQALSSGRP